MSWWKDAGKVTVGRVVVGRRWEGNRAGRVMVDRRWEGNRGSCHGGETLGR